MNSIVKFEKAPLIEVLFEVFFECPEFTSSYFGVYWETIRSQFPQAIDREPNQVGNEEEITISSIPPLRKVWFISENKQELIQLQNNYFAFNWRVTENQNYPHFQSLLESFLQKWSHFQNWLQDFSEQKIPIQPFECRLAYLNLIGEKLGWSSPEDNSKVFTFISKSWKDLQNPPKLFDCEILFEMPNNKGFLSVSLDQRVNYNEETEEESEFIFLRLNAKSNSTLEKNDIKNWYVFSHDYLIQTFLQLIQEEIQNDWGRYHD